jgi:beta-glucosidase
MWGVATSAFQIEGALDADGRGASIWDRFAGESGETGAVACDHYRRWRSDLDLLGELGANAYRFSIAWPRLFPDGVRLERRGLDHYDRLIDELLERGVEPVVTLHHSDLPAALGDWRSRDVVERFADYAATCFAAYGDRVRWWVTINEPWIVGVLGYQLGIHAPGVRDLRASVQAMHHLLLAHGRAVQALRASGRGGRAGVAHSLFPHAGDEEAARLSDGYVNRWSLDPVLRGSYPADMRELYEQRLGQLDLDADLGTIAAGCDFIGVNYYTRRVMRAAPGRDPFPWEVVTPAGAPLTDGGWEIAPDALRELLLRLHADYGDVPLLITENGGIFDEPFEDVRRVEFLRAHVAAMRSAIEAGAPVRGYFHWSLMDNFEWALGYAPRFGLVHVDYGTQARTIKASGREYARIAREDR